MRLKASDTGGIWPYEKRLTPRYFIPPQSGPMGVLKRLLRKPTGERYLALEYVPSILRGCLKTIFFT